MLELWKDELLSGEPIYTIIGSEGVIADDVKLELKSLVVQAGTPVSAGEVNKIVNAINGLDVSKADKTYVDNNFMVYKKMPDGTDVNTLTNIGCYGVYNGVNAPSPNMCSIEVFVESANWLGQRGSVFADDGRQGTVFERYYNGLKKTWTAWREALIAKDWITIPLTGGVTAYDNATLKARMLGTSTLQLCGAITNVVDPGYGSLAVAQLPETMRPPAGFGGVGWCSPGSYVDTTYGCGAYRLEINHAGVLALARLNTTPWIPNGWYPIYATLPLFT